MYVCMMMRMFIMTVISMIFESVRHFMLVIWVITVLKRTVMRRKVIMLIMILQIIILNKMIVIVIVILREMVMWKVVI